MDWRSGRISRPSRVRHAVWDLHLTGPAIMIKRRLPTYFLSHGGGPWPWMKELRPGAYDRLEKSLHDVREELGDSPRAVLMISGHWEADRFLLSSAARPPMVFDYSGFPEHTYKIRYDAPANRSWLRRSEPCWIMAVCLRASIPGAVTITAPSASCTPFYPEAHAAAGATLD